MLPCRRWSPRPGGGARTLAAPSALPCLRGRSSAVLLSRTAPTCPHYAAAVAAVGAPAARRPGSATARGWGTPLLPHTRRRAPPALQSASQGDAPPVATDRASEAEDTTQHHHHPLPPPAAAPLGDTPALEEGGWISWLWPNGQGRKRKVAALFASAYLEWWLTGALFWSPALCCAVLVLVAPAYEALRRSQEQAVAAAVAQTRAEMAKQVPVTPFEPAQWMNRLVSDTWPSYIEPMILKAELSAWQEKVASAAPSGWDLQLTEVHLGKDAPVLTNFRAFNNPLTHELSSLECSMVLDSSSMRVVVQGAGPLGSFTATVSGMRMTGTLRFLPLPGHRMLLWAFKEPPEASVRLAVRGPVIGERDIPQFAFIQRAFLSALQESLVEPRRTALSLDYEYIVQQAVDTTVNMYVEAVTGLAGPAPVVAVAPEAGRSLAGGRTGASSSIGVVSSATITPSLPSPSGGKTTAAPALASTSGTRGSKGRPPRQAQVQVQATNTFTKLQRSTLTRQADLQGDALGVNQLLKVGLGSKDGIIKLEVRDMGRSGASLGVAYVNVLAAKDGSTLFWAIDAAKDPIAHRWRPSTEPWRVTLPLEGAVAGASVTLALSVDPWLYHQALPAGTFRTQGPRTILFQVMEGRHLAAHDWAGTSDPYVSLGYDGKTYRTRSVYNTLQPMWAATFAFAENPSLLTRRVRVECWDSGISRDELMGKATASLDMVHESTVQDMWLQLAGAESGDVRVRMAVVPGAPTGPAALAMVALLNASVDHASTDTLQVVVLMARNLASRGGSHLLGQRDAYVNVTYRGARQVTPVAKQTQNPTWNFPLLFPLDAPTTAPHPQSGNGPAVSSNGASPPSTPADQAPTSLLPAQHEGRPEGLPVLLRLRVKDLGAVPGGDEELGAADLDVSHLLNCGPGTTWEQWVPLRNKGGPSGAEILVRLTHLAPAAHGQGPMRLQPMDTTAAGGGGGGGGAGLSGATSAAVEGAVAAVIRDGRPAAWTPAGAAVTMGGSAAAPSLLSRLTEQVALASASVQQASEGLRTQLGTQWVPMVRDALSSATAKSAQMLAEQRGGVKAVKPSLSQRRAQALEGGPAMAAGAGAGAAAGVSVAAAEAGLRKPGLEETSGTAAGGQQHAPKREDEAAAAARLAEEEHTAQGDDAAEKAQGNELAMMATTSTPIQVVGPLPPPTVAGQLRLGWEAVAKAARGAVARAAAAALASPSASPSGPSGAAAGELGSSRRAGAVAAGKVTAEGLDKGRPVEAAAAEVAALRSMGEDRSAAAAAKASRDSGGDWAAEQPPQGLPPLTQEVSSAAPALPADSNGSVSTNGHMRTEQGGAADGVDVAAAIAAATATGVDSPPPLPEPAAAAAAAGGDDADAVVLAAAGSGRLAPAAGPAGRSTDSDGWGGSADEDAPPGGSWSSVSSVDAATAAVAAAAVVAVYHPPGAPLPSSAREASAAPTESWKGHAHYADQLAPAAGSDAGAATAANPSAWAPPPPAPSGHASYDSRRRGGSDGSSSGGFEQLVEVSDRGSSSSSGASGAGEGGDGQEVVAALSWDGATEEVVANLSWDELVMPMDDKPSVTLRP